EETNLALRGERETDSWCWRFSGALDDRCDLSTDYMEEYLSEKLPALRCQSVCLSRHLCFNWFAPNQQLRRQLDNPTSQAKTLNPSTPGGSSNSN
ncbi:hypothetical protein AMECASPLE_022173, partial [Ameca splendens]